MFGETFAKQFHGEIEWTEHVFADSARKLVPHWKHAHPPVRNMNKEVAESSALYHFITRYSKHSDQGTHKPLVSEKINSV
jgi:hypothetical protein